jgi:hypothetical protein
MNARSPSGGFAPANLTRAAETAPRLRIALASPVFTDMVLADVDRVRRTQAGRAAFRRLRDLGRTLSIERTDPGIDPPNAWTKVTEPDDEIVVAYDPADWPCAAWPGSPPSDVVLFTRIVDAILCASGSDPSDLPGAAGDSLLNAYREQRKAIPDPVGRANR